VGRAAREDLLERALSLARYVGAESELWRHDAVEHDRARVRGEAAQIVLRDARAVRHPVDVPPLDPERRAHAVEVLHRDGGRVEARIVLELAEAARDVLAELRGARR